MSILEIPGHDRDALAAPDVVGFDNVRQVLDAIAYDEWAAAQDEYDPTTEDERTAAIAAQG